MNQQEINIADAIFKVNTSSGSGSGFFLKKRNIFVTNYHVIAGNRRVAIEDQHKNRYTAKVVFANPDADVAFLEAEAELQTPDLDISEKINLKTRDHVFVLGFPFGMPYTVTEGIVSSTKQFMDGRYYIQTDAAVNPGNSGGPVINQRGELVGITTAKFSDADNVGFAIPIEVLREELESLKQNTEHKYAIKCNSCKSLIYEKTEYCSNCGAKINPKWFDQTSLTNLGEFVENAISPLVDPVLARAGFEFWSYHQGSSLVRIFVYNKSYLLATSPMNDLPSQGLEELYRYMLKNPVEPYQLGVTDNQIFLSYRVHLSEVFHPKYSEQVKEKIANLALKADDMDDFFVEKFNCPMSEYAKQVKN